MQTNSGDKIASIAGRALPRARIAGRNKHSTESLPGWHGYAHYGACRLSAQHGDAAQHQVNRVSRIARSKLLAIGGHTALPISFRLLVALVPSGNL